MKKYTMVCSWLAAFVAKIRRLKRFIAFIKQSQSKLKTIGERGEIHEI